MDGKGKAKETKCKTKAARRQSESKARECPRRPKIRQRQSKSKSHGFLKPLRAL